MLSKTNAPRDDNAFRRLYPDLTGQELEQAEENFTRYLDVAIRLWQRIENEPEALQRLRELTAERSQCYDHREQSSPASSHSHP